MQDANVENQSRQCTNGLLASSLEQCRLSAWAHWAVARGPTSIGAPC